MRPCNLHVPISEASTSYGNGPLVRAGHRTRLIPGRRCRDGTRTRLNARGPGFSGREDTTTGVPLRPLGAARSPPPLGSAQSDDGNEFNVSFSLSTETDGNSKPAAAPSASLSPPPSPTAPSTPPNAPGFAEARLQQARQQRHGEQAPPYWAHQPRTPQAAPRQALRQQRGAAVVRGSHSGGTAAWATAPRPALAAAPAPFAATPPGAGAAAADARTAPRAAAFAPRRPPAGASPAARWPAAVRGAGVAILPTKLTSILSLASTVGGLEGCVARWGAHFNFRHVSCCLNRLAKAGDVAAPEQQPRVQQLLARLDAMLLEHVRDCTARELCNALWVWAKLGHAPAPATWEAVRAALFGAEAAGGNGAGGGAGAPQPGHAARGPAPTAGLIALTSPQGAVNAAWALAKLGCADALAWRRLCRHALATVDGFSPYDISNLAYALVSARQHAATPAASALMAALASAAVRRIDQFCPQDLANILWAYARAELPQPALFAAASRAVRQTLPGFSYSGIGQVVWAFGALRVSDMALLAAVAREMQPRLYSIDSRNLSLLVWALARVVMTGSAAGSAAALRAAAEGREGAGGGGPIFASLAARVRGGLVDPLNGSYWSGGGGVAAGTAAAAAAAEVAGGGSGRADEAALLPGAEAGAVAAADEEGGGVTYGSGGGAGGGGATFARWAVLEIMADSMELELPADPLESPVVADAAAVEVGAAAGLPGPHPPATGAAAAAAAAAAVGLPQMQAAAAASATAAAARAQLPPHFLTALSDALLARVHSLEPRYLTVMLWAMATLGAQDARLFGAGAQVLTRRLREAQPGCTPPSVAHTAWSFATARYYDPSLYDVLAEAALRMARDAAAGAPGALPPGEVSLSLANVLWALGSAGHYHPALFAAAPRVVLAAVAAEAACANHLALVMLGCAYTRHADAAMYGELAGLMRALGPRAFSDASLSNVAWSLAMVDHRALPLLAELFGDLAARRADTFGARGCTQLFQCCMWLQDLVPGGSEVAALLPPQLRQVGLANWRELAKGSIVSDFQMAVFRSLESLGLQPAMETKTPDRLFSLDTLVSYRGLSLVVESNGPQHYLRTHPTELTGSTCLRSALLRARGFHQLHVNYLQWAELGGDRERQRRFLAGQLDELADAVLLGGADGAEAARSRGGARLAAEAGGAHGAVVAVGEVA